jgi:competence protein ComEC
VRIAITEYFGKYKWGGLALALLLGIRDNLQNDIAVNYRKAGVSYILALSGMHLAIISALIAFLLKKPLGLKGAAIAGSVIVVLYVYIVGAQPSLERAAIMYILGSLALIKALPKSPGLILSLSFIIQTVNSPVSALSISFILSYSALAGILLLNGIFTSILRGIIPDKISSPLSASLGAFLATASITLGCFGELRPIGILAGLVMVPLTTVFMVLSLAAPILLLIPGLQQIANFTLSAIYTALDLCSRNAATLPAIKISESAAGLNAAILVNTAIIVLLFIAYRKLNAWRMSR